MKKRIFAVLLIAVLLLASGCRKATLEGYKLFRSTPLGFSVEYPDFWQETHDNKEGIAAFVSPAEGYGDEHLDNLSVQRFALVDTAFADYVKNYVAHLPQTVTNYHLVSESEEATLGGVPAYEIVYESTSDDGEDGLRFLQIFAEHEGKVYLVTYLAEFNSYQYFLTNGVEQMLSTFAFV